MSARQPLKVGVVGCGSMGKNHLRVLSTMSEYELVGCYDADYVTAKEQADLYGIACFESTEQLFEAVEVAHVVVPSSLHREVAIQAAEHGCHVLVEKPIALNLEDAQAIIDACSAQGVRLCVGHVERFNPAVIALSQVVETEDLLAVDFRRMSPYYGRISDASVVQDLMIHDIDVLNSLVDAPIKRVVAHGTKARTGRLDHCQALVTYENGFLASLTASRITEAKIRSADVTCMQAHISMDYLLRSVDISRKTSFKLDTGHDIQYKQENIVERVVVSNIEPLRAEFKHFAHCIHTGETVKTSGEMAKLALELCERIEEEALC